MSIATSIEKLSETLTNCKANLKEKEVADVDNIKISDVDEKIAEIQAGGGSSDSFRFLKNVTYDNTPLKGSFFRYDFELDDPISFSGTFKFTPKEDGVYIRCFETVNCTINPDISDFIDKPMLLTKDVEYTLNFNNVERRLYVLFAKQQFIDYEDLDEIDSFIWLKG